MSEWFGELPKRWETRKVSELFIERNEKVSDTDYAPLSVSKGGIVPQIATVAKSNAGDNRKLVKKGDFSINSRSDRRGSSGISDYDGSVSLINIVLTLRNDSNKRYLHYLLKSHNFIEEYYRNGRGIVSDLWTTRYTELKNINLPLPSREEQDKIVRFLDWKVSQTNRLINAKKKQIVLLQEQKRAVINDAVTKAGDGWGKDYFSKIAIVCANLVSPNQYLDYPQVSPANIEKDTGRMLPYVTVKEAGIISYNHLFFKNQILYSKVRPMLNKVTVAPFDGLCSADMYPIETQLNTQYLVYFMLSATFLSQLSMTENRVKMPKINRKELSSIIVLYPSLDEQQSIVAELDDNCAKIDRLITTIQREIKLLHEYRTRLISDAVIGKMDVLEVDIPQYEAVEEVVEIDEAQGDDKTESEE